MWTIRPVASWLLLVSILCTGKALWAQRVLDLTKPAPSTGSLGVPGMIIGGIVDGPGERIPPEYQLPISTNLKSAKEYPPDPRQLIVKMEIVNKGTKAFGLPASSDQVATQGRPGTGRRNFDFEFEFSSAGQKPALQFAYGTCSSDLAKNSTVHLAPGEKVVVLVKVQIPPPFRTELSIGTPISIRAVSSETTLEERRYFIKDYSEKVRSDNTLQISP